MYYILIADVLQTLNTDVGDTDAVRHKVCLNKHLIAASFLVFDALQRHSVFTTKTIKFIVLSQIFVFLSDGYSFTEFVSGFGEKYSIAKQTCFAFVYSF